jgi:hypothetical protein
MPYSINDLSRLSLHDSSLESVTRRGTNLELVFDWAKLAHLAEADVAESVILGHTTLVLTDIRQETFELYEECSMRAISPIEGSARLGLITDNKLPNSDTLLINGLFIETAGSNWIEWRITFATIDIFWNTFIRHSEWLAGKLPSD